MKNYFEELISVELGRVVNVINVYKYNGSYIVTDSYDREYVFKGINVPNIINNYLTKCVKHSLHGYKHVCEGIVNDIVNTIYGIVKGIKISEMSILKTKDKIKVEFDIEPRSTEIVCDKLSHKYEVDMSLIKSDGILSVRTINNINTYCDNNKFIQL